MSRFFWIIGTLAPLAIILGLVSSPSVAPAQTAGAPTAAQAQAACDADNMRGCAYLAQMKTTGTGAPVDLAGGYGLYKKACEGGEKDACTEQAIGLSTGRGVGVDRAAALALADRTCTSGGAASCMFTGIQYAQGAGVAANPATALTYFEKSCVGGFSQGCSARDQLRTRMQASTAQQVAAAPLGPTTPAVPPLQNMRVPRIATVMVEQKGASPPETVPLMEQANSLYRDRKEQEARAIWRDACNKGNAEACSIRSGQVDSTMEIARQLSERACNLGSARGCQRAGNATNSPSSGTPDPQKSRGYISQSCRLGLIGACENIVAWSFFGGSVFPKDIPRVATLGEDVCAQGGGSSCYYVGQLFELGGYVALDLEAAKNYYQRGCELDSALGCGAFALMLETGRGVARDLGRALATFELGCKLSNNIYASCAGAARMYFNGIGAPSDLEKAAAFGKKSCYLLDGNACRNNIVSILAARTVPSDPEVGLRQAEAFCQAGTMLRVCGLLGEAVFKGTGIANNQDRGRALMGASCSASDRETCSDLERINRFSQRAAPTAP
jgi:uncharacterized protein